LHKRRSKFNIIIIVGNDLGLNHTIHVKKVDVIFIETKLDGFVCFKEFKYGFAKGFGVGFVDDVKNIVVLLGAR
jgi:hypothetical protein